MASCFKFGLSNKLSTFFYTSLKYISYSYLYLHGTYVGTCVSQFSTNRQRMGTVVLHGYEIKRSFWNRKNFQNMKEIDLHGFYDLEKIFKS